MQKSSPRYLVIWAFDILIVVLVHQFFLQSFSDIVQAILTSFLTLLLAGILTMIAKRIRFL